MSLQHTISTVRDELDRWFDALQERHLAELEWAEVTRALRALSSAYVQRREKLAAGAALDGRGKRAAFALFYGPMHFAAVARVLAQLAAGGENVCGPDTLVDLGCGTGAGGAAWALTCERRPRVSGIDIHPWAASEATWTYRFFRVDGAARRGDAAQFRPPSHAAVLAAYTFNELPALARDRVLDEAIAARRMLLVIEPISRAVTPWWDAAARRIRAAGGRADDWKLPLDMPDRWRLLDRAAGFRRDHLTARSLWLPAR